MVGTHRLLQRDVRFKRLGLLIVDEEHRFGVMQKERLKKLRTQLDVLSLSATPIPRTLHMAVGGIRDMSVIQTPPEERQPIKTYVTADDDELVTRGDQPRAAARRTGVLRPQPRAHDPEGGGPDPGPGARRARRHRARPDGRRTSSRT